MSQSSPPPFTLAILAGGMGSRLGGVTKGLIQLEGAPVIERHLTLARQMGAPVLLVTRTPAPYLHFGIPCCVDETPGLGPAAGIVAGLRGAKTEAVIFIGCDMPWVSAPVLERLLEGASQRPRCFEVDGRLEPLPSLWWRGALEAEVETPLSLRRLLELADVEALSEEVLREVDPELESLRSLNRPEDLRAVNARLPSRSSRSLP